MGEVQRDGRPWWGEELSEWQWCMVTEHGGVCGCTTLGHREGVAPAAFTHRTRTCPAGQGVVQQVACCCLKHSAVQLAGPSHLQALPRHPAEQGACKFLMLVRAPHPTPRAQALWQRLAEQAKRMMSQFNSAQVVSLTWALSKRGHTDESVHHVSPTGHHSLVTAWNHSHWFLRFCRGQPGAVGAAKGGPYHVRPTGHHSLTSLLMLWPSLGRGRC